MDSVWIAEERVRSDRSQKWSPWRPMDSPCIGLLAYSRPVEFTSYATGTYERRAVEYARKEPEEVKP